MLQGVFAGLLLAAWLGWMSTPRFVIPLLSNWGESGSISLPAEPIGVLSSDGFVATNELGTSPLGTADRWKNVDGWYVGGFPFDSYHVLHQDAERRTTIVSLAMIVNLLTASVLVIGMYLLAYVKDPRGSFRSLLCLRGIRRSSVVLVVGIGCVLGPLASLHFFRCYQANRLTPRGDDISLVRTIRSPFFDATPVWFQSPWTHIHEMRLSAETFTGNSGGNGTGSPTTRKRVPIRLDRYPGLQAIYLRGTFSEEALDQIAAVPMLRSLSWHQPGSVGEIQELVAAIDRLESLNISLSRRRSPARSNGAEMPPRSDDFATQERALDLRHLGRLQLLRLTNYPSRAFELDSISELKELQQFEWEIKGDIESPICLIGLEQMRSLSISTRQTQSTNLEVDLRKMPNLTAITLPAAQPLDMTLRDLPLLKYIAGRSLDVYYEGREEITESVPLVSGLTLENATSLMALNLATKSLSRWEIELCPRLRSITINGDYRLSEPDESSDLNEPNESKQIVDRKTDQNVVRDFAPLWDWLSREQPINSLSFSNFSLRKVDFSMLSRQRFLQLIEVTQCDTTAKQLEQFAAIASLRKLRAETVPVSVQNVANLLAANGQWESLLIDWVSLPKIEIRNQPLLKKAFANREITAKEIELENLPRLDDSIFTTGSLQKLKLVNIPQFAGIFINGRLPANAIFEGLTSLSHFCIVGSRLTNQQIESLHQCEKLETLGLLGCEIPVDFLSGLQRWRKLSILDFKGLQIFDGNSEPELLADRHLAVLGQIKSLTRVNLDRSRITGETIAVLASCHAMQALSVRGCRLSQKDLEPLVLLKLMTELQVGANQKVPPKLESVTVQNLPNMTPEQTSTFELTWNSMFTGEQKIRGPVRMQRGHSNRRQPRPGGLTPGDRIPDRPNRSGNRSSPTP